MGHLDQGHALQLRDDHALLQAVLRGDAARDDLVDRDAIAVECESDAAVELAEEEGRPAGDDQRPRKDERQMPSGLIVEAEVHRADTSRGSGGSGVRDFPERLGGNYRLGGR